MQIRPANNTDAPAIRALVFGVLRSYGLTPDPAETDRDLDDIEKNYLQAGGAFAVLDDGGGVIGCYGLFRLADDECELRKMYLLAAYRGQGLGRRLLEHALARARELGFGAVRLETASVLQEAIGLYRAYGFVPCQAEHLSARCDQAYRKILAPSDPPPGESAATFSAAPLFPSSVSAPATSGREHTPTTPP